MIVSVLEEEPPPAKRPRTNASGSGGVGGQSTCTTADLEKLNKCVQMDRLPEWLQWFERVRFNVERSEGSESDDEETSASKQRTRTTADFEKLSKWEQLEELLVLMQWAERVRYNVEGSESSDEETRLG